MLLCKYMKGQIIAKLQQLNLSVNEAKIYSTLLETKQTTAGQIIKKTQIHRAVVYDTLDKLIDKKLVFKIIKKNTAFFQPTNPSKLLETVEMQRQIAQGLVPDLQKLMQSALPKITVYEGVESYRTFWFDSLKKIPIGGTDYVAGSIGEKWFEYMGEKKAEEFLKQRIKRKILWKMIVFEKSEAELELVRKYPKYNEYRLIEKGKNIHGNFNVFDDKSVLLHSATEPLLIEIENETLVKVLKNIFDLLWDMGKKLK